MDERTSGLAEATTKKPPAWDPKQKSYAFRDYSRDVILWSAATDLREDQQGPALALQLRGEAREFVRDLDPDELRQGRVDQQTGQRTLGVTLLLEEMQRRFGPLEQSRAIEVVEAFLSFKRNKGEGTDLTISRFEDTYRRAHREGGLGLNPVNLSYLLTQMVNLSAEELLVMLNDFGGSLPRDEAQYVRFKELTRRHMQRQERVREGQAPLNFSGDNHRGQPQCPTWSEHEWQEDDGDAWNYGYYGNDWWPDESYEDQYDVDLEDQAEEDEHLGPNDNDEDNTVDEEEAYLTFLAGRREFRSSKGKGRGKTSPFHRARTRASKERQKEKESREKATPRKQMVSSLGVRSAIALSISDFAAPRIHKEKERTAILPHRKIKEQLPHCP
eukprot:5131896-Amphidinium_carterae.1